MSEGRGARRLFVGLRPPEALSSELHDRCARVLAVPALAPVAAGDLHLTLVFLGMVGEAAAGDLLEALDRALRPTRAFELALGGAGAFPRADDARVVWCGVRDEPDGALHELAARTHAVAGTLGIPCEPLAPRERWIAHMTLARKRRDAKRRIDARGIASAVEELLPGRRGDRWRVDEALLFESRAGAEPGARYGVLARVPLTG